MRFIILAALIALAGCSFMTSDGSRCHVGSFEPSYCVVAHAPNEVVVTGAGAIATFNTAGGMVGEGVAVGTLLAK